MIKIFSYVGVNSLSFDSDETSLEVIFGENYNKRKNHENEIEYHFDKFIIRFDALTKKFRECTLLPGIEAKINEDFIAWDGSFLNWLASEDNELKEILGFIVSLKLGIAVSGFHDFDEPEKAIHAFRKGDWDMFSNRMKPFVLS